MRRNQVVEQAGRATALRTLPADSLRAFVDAAERQAIPAGATLFEEGDPGDRVFLILRGGLWLEKEIDGGQRSRIALRSDLEWLGEMSLDGVAARSAAAVAEGPVQVLAWPREDFVAMLADNPGAALDLLTYVSQHVRESDAALVEAIRKRTHELVADNERLDLEVRRLRHDEGDAAAGGGGFRRFVGHSPAARAARRAGERAARGGGAVLLVGEPGTGRALMARCIHDASDRRSAAFARLDVTDASPDWVEAELLGCAAGTPESGVRPGPGLLERAAGGTLYLESVDALPWPLQSVLLRFVRSGLFERVGEARTRESDVRILSSTSGDPREAVRTGRLREDLLQELDRLRVNLPGLRDRRTDVPLLAAHLVAAEGAARGVEPLSFAPSALRVLSRYDFPGNLDELVAEIDLLYATLEPGSRVTSQDLGPRFVQGDPSTAEHYSEAVRAFKAQLISNAVREARGNRARAAERLGLHRSNLTRMIRDLELDEVL